MTCAVFILLMPKKTQSPKLKLDLRNVRKHGGRNKAMIRQSLEEVGGFRSIAVDGENIIRAGNGVFEQAKELGLKVRVVDANADELIAVRRRDLTGRNAERAALLDNRSGELAEWDAGILSELAMQDSALLANLWDERELQDLLSAGQQGAGEEKTDPNELIKRANELQRKWKVQRGDVWEIAGNGGKPKRNLHRLMCGDSLNQADIQRLMNGAQAALAFTSPPYWVGKEFETQKTVQEIDAFIRQACIGIARAVRKDCSRIVINTGTGFTSSFDKRKKRQLLLLIDKWANCFFDLGWNLRHIRHWLKSAKAEHPISKSADLIDQHSEFLETFEHDDGKPMKFDDLLSEEDINLMATFYNREGASRGQERVGRAGMKWIFKSYWDDVRGEARQHGHPASFPVELAGRHILLYSQPSEIVLDVFAGAGTTIVAAELLGRIGCGMEIDPKYCAVMLERLTVLGLVPKRADRIIAPKRGEMKSKH